MYSETGREWCDTCRGVAEKAKKAPKCEIEGEECKNTLPPISVELNKVITCFTLCESQLRFVGDSGYCNGLDYSPIIQVARDLGIKTNETFYKLLKVFENVLVNERNDRIKRYASR